MGQKYSESLSPLGEHGQGPALLIYYGPAYLQSLGSDNAAIRLSLLAEVYRCVRELWPATIQQVGQNVTVRIDTIKNLSTQEILQASMKGDVWIVVRHNDNEAFVERSSKKKLNKFIAKKQGIQVLDTSSLIPMKDNEISSLLHMERFWS